MCMCCCVVCVRAAYMWRRQAGEREPQRFDCRFGCVEWVGVACGLDVRNCWLVDCAAYCWGVWTGPAVLRRQAHPTLLFQFRIECAPALFFGYYYWLRVFGECVCFPFFARPPTDVYGFLTTCFMCMMFIQDPVLHVVNNAFVSACCSLFGISQPRPLVCLFVSGGCASKFVCFCFF